MAFTLVSTWGALAANSYISVADADDFFNNEYLDSRPWSNADTPDKQRALVMATQQIDSIKRVGFKYFWNQNLEFPRILDGSALGTVGDDGPDSTFFSIVEQDEFLRLQRLRVPRATAIQANYLLRNSGRNLELEEYNAGLGAVSITRAGVSESRTYRDAPSLLVTDAADLLGVYGTRKLVFRG
jgi:hypothetical protein